MIEIRKGKKNYSLRSTLFWDLNTFSLDAVGSKSIITKRELTFEKIKEFTQRLMFYSLLEDLKIVMVRSGRPEGQTLNFISAYQDILKENFLTVSAPVLIFYALINC